MTTLREAAQQALVKLEKLRVTIDSEWGECRDLDEIEIAGDQWQEVIGLRAALAEPEQEPVAWMVYTLDGKSVCVTDNPADFTDEHRVLPLYTTPTQRKPPATIDEMFDRMDKAPKGVFFGHDPMTIWMEAWRAAEQHHGIKEGT